MLSIFRKGVTSKIMLVVLAIGLFAIVVTGFGTGGSGIGGLSGGGTVASAGDEELSAAELSDTVSRQFDRAREQQPELDIAAFLATAYNDIVDQMITAKALLAFGRDIGIAASDRMVDGEIASIPAFHNFTGQFDETTYRAALVQERISEQQLRDELESSLIQRQMLLPIAANIRVPQGLALQYASLLLERRTGTVGVVPAEAIPAGPAPTPAELATFYQQNRARYTVPERRVIRYAIISPDQLGAAAQPTDAEIAAYYRANAARYGAQETRTISQVVLPSQQAAQAFAAKLAGGTGFDQAAAEAGFSRADTAVGEQSRAQFTELTSAAVAAAAFGAADGAVTQPIQSDFGWHVVRVDAINRSAGRSLADVRGEIAEALGAQKTQEALATLITRVEDAIGDGSTLQEVAQANRLQLRETQPLTATGNSEAGAAPPAEILPLLKTAFEMEPDEDPVVETIGEGAQFAVMDIARVVPAAPPPLAQIEAQVRADLIQRRANQRARAVAAEIVAAINAGTAPREAFAAADIDLPAPEPIDARRLDISQGGQQVPPPLQMLFSMKQGTAKLLQAPNGAGWFVVHLATTEAGDARGNPALVQATQSQFAQVIGQEYIEQFTRAAQAQVGVERDADAIAEVRRQLQGPGAQ